MLIAITGSSGFIGKHLAKSIISKGHEVRLIQKLSGPNVFQISDIATFDNWAKAFEGVDIVIHCASKVHCFDRPTKKIYREFEKINVLATEKIAMQSAKSKVKRLIFLSTIKVNGEKTKIGFPLKNNSPTCPEDLYAKSKLKAEKILKSISQEENLEIVIIRSPLVYGPNVNANFLKLMEFIYKGFPLPFLSINNKRSIIYVENLVSFIIICLKNDSAKNKTFLVSDALPISTPDLIKLISQFLKKNLKLFPCPLFILSIVGFITKTSNKLDKLIESLEIDPKETYEIMNWSPPFTTEKGIRKTVNWYKNLKNNEH